jgi:hypothetical protein
MGSSLHDDLAQRHEIKLCKEDRTYFISKYLKIYETRPQYGIGFKPFNLWPRQVEFIHALDDALTGHHGLLVEKCRDMGATLTALAWIYTHWLFDDDFHALLGSLKEDEVKLRDGHDSLFAKLRDFLDCTPDWLLPKDFNRDRHLLSLSLTLPKGKDPKTDEEKVNTITGASCTENFGRSRRSTVILRDEGAFWPFDTSGNTVYTTDTAIDISTVNGLNHWHDLAVSMEELGRRFIFNWDDNPSHTQEWFLAKKLETRHDPAKFAREVLRDYAASVQGVVYEAFDFAIVSDDYQYNPDLPLYTATDLGLADETVILFIQRDPDTKEIFVIDEVVANNQSIDFFVGFFPASKVVTPNPYVYTPEQEAQRKLHKQWQRPLRNFCDKSGDARNQVTGTTAWDKFKEFSVKMEVDEKNYYNMAERTRITREAMDRVRVNKSRCKIFIASMQLYHYPEKKPSTSEKGPKPLHDKYSHACTAFEYFCISERRCDRDTEILRSATRFGLTPRDKFATRKELRAV